MKNITDHMFNGDTGFDERTVAMYMRKIEKGETLRAPVMCVIDGEYHVIDGRHRLEAARRCGITSYSGRYIVNIPVEEIDGLRRALNQHHLDN